MTRKVLEAQWDGESEPVPERAVVLGDDEPARPRRAAVAARPPEKPTPKSAELNDAREVAEDKLVRKIMMAASCKLPVEPRAELARAELVARPTVTTVSGGTSPAAWVLGSAGLLGLGAGGLLTYWGRKDNDALGQCAPWCATETKNHVRNLYLAADVSIGVGAAALIAGIWLFARGSSAPQYVVDVKPMPGGAVASVGDSF